MALDQPRRHHDGSHQPLGECALRLTREEFRWVERALASLTPREREVVRAICEGGANESMADRLCIAVPTLRTHLMRINQKLGATDKSDVVRFVAARVAEGYRRGRIGSVVSRIVEVKPSTRDSTGFDSYSRPRKSSLAMTTGAPADRQ